MSRADYDLEEYARALEVESEQDDRMIWADEHPHDYANDLFRVLGYRQGLKMAAEMLRGTPSSLWTTWPDYFPDPEAKDD